MNCYDEQLQQLQEQMMRSRQLDAMIKELYSQRDSLTQQVSELKTNMLEEQADVDRLEGRSLTAFFYNVIGKMDEKLDKEREEAYAARVKYDAAVRELEGVENDLSRYEFEQSTLQGCASKYEAVLQKKADEIKASGSPKGEEIFRLEERKVFLESQKKELQEAVNAGNKALNTTEQVLSKLDSAEGWGTWDLLGGGLIADLAKHSSLDEAQEAIEQLQSQLRSFRTELSDVIIQADIQVNVDGFLRFADYFFDGLFADWTVLDKINDSQKQVENTKKQIEEVLHSLKIMMQSAEREQAEIRNAIDALVRDAKV